MLRNDAVEVILGEMKTHGCDIVSYGWSWGYTPQFEKNVLNIEGLDSVLYSDQDFYKIREIVCTGHFSSLCNKAFAASLFSEMKDDSQLEKMNYGEDFLQLLKIIDKSSTLKHIDKPLYFCRENLTSTTHNYRDNYIDNYAMMFASLNNYAIIWGGACPSIAQSTICRSCYSLAVLMSTSIPLRKYRNSEYDKVVSLLKNFISAPLNEVIKTQSIAPRIILKLLTRGHYSSSYLSMIVVDWLYSLRLRLN